MMKKHMQNYEISKRHIDCAGNIMPSVTLPELAWRSAVQVLLLAMPIHARYTIYLSWRCQALYASQLTICFRENMLEEEEAATGLEHAPNLGDSPL